MIAGARFLKLSGGGNDFLVLDALEGGLEGFGAADAARLCLRRLSVGADGVVLLRRSERADARFELWNRDGSRAAFSGNGGRCAVRALIELGRAEGGRASLETEDGVVGAEWSDQGEGLSIGLEIAPPRDLRPAVELPPGAPADEGVYAVVGVPYLAVPVADVDAVDLEEQAPPLRGDRRFPEGANVAFYEPGRDPVHLRTWERGVEGETLSSGTGCAIVALALALHGGELAEDGELETRFRPRSGIESRVVLSIEKGRVVRVLLVGDARLVAEGRLGPDAVTGFTPP